MFQWSSLPPYICLWNVSHALYIIVWPLGPPVVFKHAFRAVVKTSLTLSINCNHWLRSASPDSTCTFTSTRGTPTPSGSLPHTCDTTDWILHCHSDWSVVWYQPRCHPCYFYLWVKRWSVHFAVPVQCSIELLPYLGVVACLLRWYLRQRSDFYLSLNCSSAGV